MLFDTSGNPFVGLRPFESHESLLFFGRQEQTLQLLQRLHQHHFVAVIGNSGSGKSSLIRAGLIPRLQAGYLVNDADKWIIAMMRPGQTPLCNLSKAILSQLNQADNSIDSTALEKKINELGADVILDILLPQWARNQNFFLLVDQFEELFRFSLNQKEVEKRDEAIYFVNILLELSKQTVMPVYVVITMRSDFIGDCAKFYGLPEAMNESQYIVPRLNRIQLKSTIEGPVKLYNERIHPALTAKLLNDVVIVKDELPLLQHTLMRIWEKEISTEKKSELDLTGYESVGGIEKALSIHADEALELMPEASLRLTKKLFQALTAVDENGRKIRRPVRLSELVTATQTPAADVLALLNRFVEDKRSFLFISRLEGNDDMLIDISHESLIRQWSTLNTWVEEEAESAKIFLRLAESAKLYAEKKKDFLSDNELHQALDWYRSFHPTAEWARRYNPDFDNSIRYLHQSEREWKAAAEEKERQRLKKVRNLWLLFTAAILTGIVIGLLAYLTYEKNLEIHNHLARNYWNNSQIEREKNNLLEALLVTAEAVTTSADNSLTQNILIDIHPFLPRARLANIFLHAGPVYKVAFSRDGKKLLTASYDSTARLWDVSSGTQIGVSMLHKGGVKSAIFSADEKKILTASNDSTARLWNALTGKQIGASLKHDGAVNSAVFSSDEKWIVTAGADGTARLWDAATHQQAGPSMKHNGQVYMAVFSPDGKQIITAGADSTARLWETLTGKQIGPSLKHGGPVNSVAFSSNGKRILTAGDDSTARLWDAVTMQQDGAWMRHNGIVNSAVFSADGKMILTAGNDSTTRLWNAATGRQIGSSMHLDNTVNSSIFSPDGKTILTAAYDHTARLWNVATQMPAGTPMVHEDIVYNAVFTPDGNSIVTAGKDGTARLWTMIKTTKAGTAIHINTLPFSAVFSGDEKKILVACFDKTARILDAATGKQTGASLKHDSAVVSACFSPDDKRILTASLDSTVRLWDAATLKQIFCIKQKADVRHAVFSPDGDRLLIVTGSDAREWNSTTGALTHIYLHNDISLNNAVYSADGEKVLTASANGIACLFDERSAKEILTYGIPGDAIKTAVLSFDGRKVLTTGEDEITRQWEVKTGNQIGTSIKQQGMVNSAVFEGRGNMILTACDDGTARLWDTLSGYQIGVSMNHRNAVKSAVFNADGRKILTAGYDSTVRIWEVEGDRDLPPGLFKLQAQVITGAELNIETNELHFIPPAEWHKRNEQYEAEARTHYNTCNYPKYNFWKYFHPEMAGKAGPGS